MKKMNYFKILKYLARFLLISLPIIFFDFFDFYYLRIFYAVINKFLLGFFGFNASIDYSSASIFYNDDAVIIDDACTGIKSFYLLFALIFAFKSDIKLKLKFFGIGIFAIFLANVLRVFIGSVLFFNGILAYENVFWSLSLNLAAFFVFYFFLKESFNRH